MVVTQLLAQIADLKDQIADLRAQREQLTRQRDQLLTTLLDQQQRLLPAPSWWAMVARRSTRRYCSGACRTRAYRHRLAIGPVELRDCLVEPISRAEAARIILPREHLGTLGRARVFYGLRIPDGRLIGAVGFGPGAHASGGDVVLERGRACPALPETLRAS